MKLSPAQRDILFEEVAAALDQVRRPELKAEYGELLAAVDRGEVPDDLMEPLQVLLEVGLESCRIRKRDLAHGEMAALEVYRRPPRGRSVAADAAGINQALQ